MTSKPSPTEPTARECTHKSITNLVCDDCHQPQCFNPDCDCQTPPPPTASKTWEEELKRELNYLIYEYGASRDQSRIANVMEVTDAALSSQLSRLEAGVRGMEIPTEIDDYDEGFNKALSDVLALIEKEKI